MAKERRGRKRNRNGSARRPKVSGRWHNMPNGKRVTICGEVMRVGGQLVEIPENSLTDATQKA